MPQIPLGKTLDVEVVERELAALWQGTAPAPEARDKAATEVREENDTTILRARAANLLVFVTDEQAVNEVHELLPELTATHPCRVLTMFADNNAPDRDIEMFVAALSQNEKAAAPRRLCCEEVTLDARGSFVGELPSAALPLLVSDLPTFLWWRAPIDSEGAVFHDLLEASDRLIVDSVTFQAPAAELLAVEEIYKQDPDSSVAISDMNWARLTSWRGLLADFYDVPAYRESLDAIDGVRISYVAPENDANAIAPQALLMTGWLASRLRWTITSNQPLQPSARTVAEFRSARSPTIKVELNRVEQSGIKPGRLTQVELQATMGNTTASFKVERSADLQRVLTEANLGAGAQRGRILPVRNRSAAQLLTREMEILCNDQIYQETLSIAAIMLER